MDSEKIQKIKTLAIIAMFSDDDLMEILVLKGGNALDIVHKVAQRSSMDLDFSIPQQFKPENNEQIETKIKKVLESTFKPEGYKIFDVKFNEKPENITPDIASFWGGYHVEFKIIESEKYNKLYENVDALRRNALVIGSEQQKTLSIQISKFEYCSTKKSEELGGITIYVYTPEMIVIEKLRAICQQMTEYLNLVKGTAGTARARDFFDIYIVIEHFKISLAKQENIALLKNIFHAKRVPLVLIRKIQDYKEFHSPDFATVRDTIKVGYDLKDFEFYFDYVVAICNKLETLWEE